MLLIDFNDWDQTWRGLLGVSSYYAPQINTLWYISMLIGFYLITPPLSYVENYNINYCYIQLSSLEFAFVNLYLEPELIIGFLLFYNICVGGCICSTRFDFRANEIVCIQMFWGGALFALLLGVSVWAANYFIMLAGGIIGMVCLLIWSSRLARIPYLTKMIRF